MASVLDLACPACDAEYPDTEVRESTDTLPCLNCGQTGLIVVWSRGEAPGVSVYHAVEDDNGRAVRSVDALLRRVADYDGHLVLDDQKHDRRVRAEEIRHQAWAWRQAQGIDAATEREAHQAGMSALEYARLRRYGTVDPTPTLEREGKSTVIQHPGKTP